VFARVFDKDGGVTNLIATISVVGVAPKATLANTGPTAEGSPVTIQFSSPFSPSPSALAAGFRYSFALDPSGLAPSFFTAESNSTITFLPVDNGTFTIYGRIIDKDNLHTEYTTTVVATDIPPTASIATTGPIHEGSQVLGDL